MNIQSLIQKAVTDPKLQKHIKKSLKINDSQLDTAVKVGVPILLGGVMNNAQDKKKAKKLEQALELDHSGDILEQLQDLVSSGKMKEGEKILKHVFGNNSKKLGKAVEVPAGLSSGTGTQLLSVLAPLIMGAVGKTKLSQHMSMKDLAKVIHSVQSGKKDSFLKSLMTSLLDKDGDGEIKDNIVDLISAQLKRRL